MSTYHETSQAQSRSKEQNDSALVHPLNHCKRNKIIDSSERNKNSNDDKDFDDDDDDDNEN